MRTSLAFGLTVCVLEPWGDGCVRQHADFVTFWADRLSVGMAVWVGIYIDFISAV